ncbi:MAG: ABC-F family ATP-binding cassette domain-containing protein [Bacilli bacterium]|nr:ABC-F family ATP-binding cassette domain-containing protein [Bacilli bacterium]
MILEAKSIYCAYGEKVLLNNIDFIVEDNDKIGLIGVNGCGKSSLLSLLALIKEPERGEIKLIGKRKISYMPQEIIIGDTSSSIEEYINSLGLNFLDVKSILTQLDILDFTKKIKELSGGNRRKLALGIALSQECDLLILDEPTNHLDSDIIEWLEKYLIKFSKAIVLVTHDRYFLERVCNKIVELDKGNVYSYEANYSRYLELKTERAEMLKAHERKINSFLRKEYEWIKRGALARTTKDKRRIENYESLTSREKVKDKSLVIDSASSRLGRKTIEFDNVGFKYDDYLFTNLSFNLNRDERIGVVGKNGTGKTTMFDLIASIKEPTEGSIVIGETIKIGYFRQENVELDYRLRAIDYISNIASYVKTKKGSISATQMLENFLFDDPYVYISKLSGGEKRRLYLLGVLMSSPNVLLFDEPTNDLDITTLSILEDYLDDFDGIVIVSSHDRYFLDRICERIMALEDKKFNFYNGNYSDYYKVRKVMTKVVKSDIKEPEKKVVKVKLTYKEQKEFETILEEIDNLETRLKEIEEFVNINYSNYNLCKDYYVEKEKLEKEIEDKMLRWEYLNDIYEKSLR